LAVIPDRGYGVYVISRFMLWLLDLPRRRIWKYIPKRLFEWTEVKRHDYRLRVGANPPLVPEQQLKQTYRDALRLLGERTDTNDLGDYLEFGVYTGTSLACMHDVLTEFQVDQVRLFGFDSFAGLPPHDEGKWAPGYFKSDLEFTQANLQERGVDMSRVELIEGWFDDTLTPETRDRHEIRKASVIMVDCDLYSSTKTALEFCAPLLAKDTVMVFDDWLPDSLAAANEGEKRAFDEFVATHPELEVKELDTYRRESKVFLLSLRSRSEQAAEATE
jgi:O-methyltransferase